MKNTLLICLASIFFFSCSPPEEDCELAGTFYLIWNIACSSCEEDEEKTINLLVEGNQIEVLEFKKDQLIQQTYSAVLITTNNILDYQIVDANTSTVLEEGQIEATVCQTQNLESFL